MQTVTVAIADTNRGRRNKLEQMLRGGQGIEVLTNVMSNGDETVRDRQPGTHAGVTEFEHIIAKISHLRPRILFVNLDSSDEADLTLIEILHRQCPETFVVLLTDKSIREERILQALANGARGYLSYEADPFYFLKAVRVVDRGEIWVTRKMLGKIIDKVLH
ncbi:MAG: response regulator transcription factor [Betaproteobacteria bacterium]|nr:response regulator transcription factor [Betaproteobacteria bacterium]